MKPALLLLLVLVGCDTEEFERTRERARQREIFWIHCMPLGQERVLIARQHGQVVCHRYSPKGVGREVEVDSRAVLAASEIEP